MDDLIFRLYSLADWEGKGRTLVEFLNSEEPFCFERWDYSEPITKPFLVCDEEFLDAWETEKWILLESESSKLWLSIRWNPKFNIVNQISGRILVSRNEPQSVFELIGFMNGLIAWGEVDYGYACLASEFEQKNILEQPAMINGKLIKSAGMNPTKYLPGIYWLNFFGKKITRHWEKKDLDGILCHKKHVGVGGITVFAYPSPYDYSTAENQRINNSIISYLGSEYFFDKANPQKPLTSILLG